MPLSVSMPIEFHFRIKRVTRYILCAPSRYIEEPHCSTVEIRSCESGNSRVQSVETFSTLMLVLCSSESKSDTTSFLGDLTVGPDF